MKTKQHEKKLKLNKTTIATLNGVEMSAVVGGDECPPQTLPQTVCTPVLTIIFQKGETTSC